MKGKNFIQVSVFLLVVIFVSFNLFSDKQFSSAQVMSASELVDEVSEVSLTDMHNLAALAVLPQANVAASSNNSPKLDYDADWCIAVFDLTPEDNDYYQQELEDWYLAIGDIRLSYTSEYNNVRSQYLLPYMEASYADIRRQIKDDNTFAMLAALQRNDFDLKSQRRIAQRLVTKGQTSVSLSHLVVLELVDAKAAFKKAGQLNSDIEKSLYRALAYAAYGIEHYDLGATWIYLNIVSSADFPVELKAVYLDKNDKVARYTEELQQLIAKSREDKNILAVTEHEVPTAAKHDFESTLAYLYQEYGAELDKLKTVLPNSSEKMLEKSKCVQQHIDLFSR